MFLHGHIQLLAFKNIFVDMIKSLRLWYNDLECKTATTGLIRLRQSFQYIDP